MPAIITHHLFGEEAARRLSPEASFTEEELLAFLLGNQGPDPYYFCFTSAPLFIQACHQFAEQMHAGKELEGLFAAHDAIDRLPANDQAIGRAFVLGLLGHYLLDSEAHPFVMAQENAICQAGVDLEDAHDQVHALIESELDTWMLWSSRRQTIDDAPAQANLARTERVSKVAGAIFSQIAWQVFGLVVDADRYEGCLRDYELVYRAIDPTGNRRGAFFIGAQRLGSRYSLLDALSHTDKPVDDCAAANLECHPWQDPSTGEVFNTSFGDVFYDTLDRWPELAAAFDTNDRTKLEQLARRHYDGSMRGAA